MYVGHRYSIDDLPACGHNIVRQLITLRVDPIEYLSSNQSSVLLNADRLTIFTHGFTISSC